MKKEEKANVILFIGPLVCGMYRRKIYEEKAKVVAAVWVTGLIQFLAALQIYRQDDVKKWIKGKMDSWRNGCFRKWTIFQFTPPPSQNGCASQNCSSNHPRCQSCSIRVTQTAATTFAFSSV